MSFTLGYADIEESKAGGAPGECGRGLLRSLIASLSGSRTAESQGAGPFEDPGSGFLLESPAGFEVQRALSCLSSTAAQICEARIGDVPRFAGELSAGAVTPIGSAAFVQTCLRTVGRSVSRHATYPLGLATFFLHRPFRCSLAKALTAGRPLFIKPVQRGQFASRVVDPRLASDSDNSASLDEVLALPLSTPVWASEVLDIASEWQMVVVHGGVKSLGMVRGGITFDEPQVEDISGIVACLPTDVACIVDLACLRSGQTSVIGLSFPWEIDLGAVSPATLSGPTYVTMMRSAWKRAMAEGRPHQSVLQP